MRIEFASQARLMSEQSVASEITIMPNPAKDYFNLQMNLDKPEENIILSIYDLHGKIVERKEFRKINKGLFDIHHSLSQKGGIYFIVIEGTDWVKKAKIVLND